MLDEFYGVYDTELGKIFISSNGDSITSVSLKNQNILDIKERRTTLTDKAALQINEYFAGKRKAFDVPIAPKGTEFQQKVWQALREIPYGQTRSYKEVAIAIGNPKGSRAVGMANHKNPILLLIPCHRVIGSKGSLVGFAVGVDVKERLLQIERIS